MKTKKTYYVMFVLVFLLVVCLVMIIYQAGASFYYALFRGAYSGLKSPCE